MKNIDLEKILAKFNINYSTERYGNGHINDTFLVQPNRYILQRINTNIFKNPQELMDNIDAVTSFIRKKIIDAGENPERQTMRVMRTTDGSKFYRYDDDNCFRVYNFISDTVTIEDDKTNEILFNAGKGFGHFQNLLDDFPAETLYETIENFHHTPKRIEALKEAVEKNIAGRADSVKEEIDFALSHADFADVVVNGMEDGTIPVRVTHNDTKINNILFDKDTLEAVCVIDLDTVMKGSVLYDFGDALRMGASTAAEDETDLSKVSFDEEAFRAFTEGFCEEVGSKLTKSEIDLMYLAPKLMTYECGIRFLTDYLNGDTYFKIHREHHNLDRARNQFKLVADMEKKADKLKAIVNEVLSK